MRRSPRYIALILGLGCAGATDPLLLRSERIEVAPTLVPCTGVGATTCLQVRNGNEPWRLFHGPIEGFSHETGFQFTLDVRVYRVPRPPADGSSERYVLERVVKREPASESAGGDT